MNYYYVPKGKTDCLFAQEKLFKMGFKWGSGRTTPFYQIDMLILYIYSENKRIYFSSDPEALLRRKITGEYKPFPFKETMELKDYLKNIFGDNK